MKKICLLLILILSLIFGIGVVFADRDEAVYEKEPGFLTRWFRSDTMLADKKGTQQYQEECGSCHFPYQPGFLPGASWRLVMAGLDDHFGENAELSDYEAEYILNYLTQNAAENVRGEIFQKVLWSIRTKQPPMRITETDFFKHEHDEISPRILHRNGEKIQFSNCDSCHVRALQGSFDDDDIKIPGYGRWDD
ncbi:MAG: diheme cytochrome c [Candidatus Thiodiazotropha lotti]|uniref:Diheme cytochrome c n=1 Tax=Candidatus Thiodiazotropha lotti TaxID=2792787 RepID=A0A9E4MZ26_9GAMM|nr:diheme cytochrome c [Candidatus Thiodiazotropha lotti]MCW4201746.1 diheme cytochrome c [Candidatus Thiodiazotropha lotti]